MVPFSAMFEQKGNSFEGVLTNDQFFFCHQGTDHTLTLKDNQISCIDGKKINPLRYLQFGGRNALWVDGKGELWMDIDTATWLIRYFED